MNIFSKLKINSNQSNSKSNQPSDIFLENFKKNFPEIYSKLKHIDKIKELYDSGFIEDIEKATLCCITSLGMSDAERNKKNAVLDYINANPNSLKITMNIHTFDEKVFTQDTIYRQSICVDDIVKTLLTLKEKRSRVYCLDELDSVVERYFLPVSTGKIQETIKKALQEQTSKTVNFYLQNFYEEQLGDTSVFHKVKKIEIDFSKLGDHK